MVEEALEDADGDGIWRRRCVENALAFPAEPYVADYKVNKSEPGMVTNGNRKDDSDHALCEAPHVCVNLNLSLNANLPRDRAGTPTKQKMKNRRSAPYARPSNRGVENLNPQQPRPVHHKPAGTKKC